MMPCQPNKRRQSTDVFSNCPSWSPMEQRRKNGYQCS